MHKGCDGICLHGCHCLMASSQTCKHSRLIIMQLLQLLYNDQSAVFTRFACKALYNERDSPDLSCIIDDNLTKLRLLLQASIQASTHSMTRWRHNIKRLMYGEASRSAQQTLTTMNTSTSAGCRRKSTRDRVGSPQLISADLV